jgi:beta-1,4-mannosyl-glycoprotein beta-1,4-N-acetylglucosaminyltransferase
MKIYDCITFFQSNLLFELRFHTLKNVVDHFVICEATKTHVGRSKKILFNLKKWKKYGDKIIFIKVNDLPKVSLKGKKDYALLKIQMERLFLGIKNASENDLIMLSDEDEIPNPDKIKNFISNEYKYGIFMQKLYNYKINILNITEGNNNWPGSRICKKKYLKSFFDLRILKIKNIYSPFWKFYKEKNIQLIKNGGWHFSYLMSPKQILNKIKNSSHTELNNKHFTNIKFIKNKIQNLEDLFDRKNLLKKVKIDKSYPKYILNNKKKFDYYTV